MRSLTSSPIPSFDSWPAPEPGRRPSAVPEFCRRHGVTLFYVLVALATFRQYGITWDELVQSRYGELALHYFTTAGHDDRVNHFLNLRWYGALFEMLPAAIYQFAPAHQYEIRHLCNVLMGAGALAGVGAYCSLLEVEPFAGQLALLFLPQFFGHSFNNSKDIPFACAIVWMMVTMVRLLDAPSRRRIVFAGLALGAALSVRVGALLFVGIVFLVILALGKRHALVPFAVSLAFAWSMMVVTWPAAHLHPFTHPAAAFGESSAFRIGYPLLFEGVVTRSDALPRRYLAQMLAITTPLPTLLLALAGIGLALRGRGTARLLLVSWLAIPMALFTIIRPNVYDGVRHFLFVLPAVALLAAIPLTRMKWLLVPLVGVPLVAMIRLHPYEMTYFNVLVGGTGGASGRYDTDYWASSYREAALWLREHRTGPRTRVLVAASPYSIECLRAYLPAAQFDVARTMDHDLTGTLPRLFDYYVATTRFGLDRNFPAAPVAKTIGRDGASFTVIKEKSRVRETSESNHRLGVRPVISSASFPCRAIGL